MDESDDDSLSSDSEVEELVGMAYKKIESVLALPDKTETISKGDRKQRNRLSTEKRDMLENSTSKDRNDISPISTLVDKKRTLSAKSDVSVNTVIKTEHAYSVGVSKRKKQRSKTLGVKKGTKQTRKKTKNSNINPSTQELKGKKKTDFENTLHKNELASFLHSGLDESDIYINVNSYKNPQQKIVETEKLVTGNKNDDKIMKKSVITPDFERKDVIPPYEESRRQLKKQRRLEREKTKGKGWYDLPAAEMNEKKKNDLLALKMRKALDPKRFYKGDDLKGLPKYFQFGTVVEGAAEFYSARIPKKQRKISIVEELMADADFRQYNKRKYAEIQDAKRRGIGPYKHIKRTKKKKGLK